MNKKQIRSNFRSEVFKRDRFICKVCGKIGTELTLNAHHITDRAMMPNGGYVKENGITVCEEICHMIVESYHVSGISKEGFSPEDLYALIKSSKQIAIEKSLKIK